MKRNALTQLLQLVCKLNFPIERLQANDRISDEQVYSNCYRLLLNGEIVRATRCLSFAGKHKMALILSQSLTANSRNKQLIRQEAALLDVSSGACPSLNRIIELVSSSGFQQSNNLKGFGDMPQSVHWQQTLLCQLMFAYEPQVDIMSILHDFVNNCKVARPGFVNIDVNGQQSAQGPVQTLFSIIAGLPELGNTSHDATRICATSKNDDFTMLWLTSLCKTMYVGDFAEEDQFDRLTGQLVQQMLRECNWNKAVLFCLFLNNKELQGQQLRDTMFVIERAMHQTKDGKASVDKFVHERLQVSPDYLQYAVAQRELANGNHAAVIDAYLRLSNSQVDLGVHDLASQAHELFLTHIVPSQFGSVELINQLLLQRISLTLRLNKKDDHAMQSGNVPAGFRNTAQRRLMDALLHGLAAK